MSLSQKKFGTTYHLAILQSSDVCLYIVYLVIIYYRNIYFVQTENYHMASMCHIQRKPCRYLQGLY